MPIQIYSQESLSQTLSHLLKKAGDFMLYELADDDNKDILYLAYYRKIIINFKDKILQKANKDEHISTKKSGKVITKIFSKAMKRS